MEGLERLKILSSEIKDDAVLEIVNYLLSREDMNEKYLNEEKSLKQMLDYIMGQAREKSKDGRAVVKDDIVFGWAIHYWDEPNKDLDFDTVRSSSKTKTKKVEEKETQPVKKEVNKEWKPEGQLTLFDFVDNSE